MVSKDAVCGTVKEYWVKEEWLIEVRYVKRVSSKFGVEIIYTLNGNERVTMNMQKV